MWAPGGAVNTHPELFCDVLTCTDVGLLLARAMWKSPIPQAMTAMQQLLADWDISEDAGKSDCESLVPSVVFAQISFYRSVFEQSASDNSVSRYVDTRRTAVLFVIFVLVCDVSVVCTRTVLLHILSGSVWVCNMWSARLWECNAHDWLKGCVVWQNRFHHHVIHVYTCAFLLLSLYTFNTHIFFLDPFIKNNLSGQVADQ